MINELSFGYPMWYVILCLLLGLLFAGFLYFKDTKFNESPAWIKWILALLRTTAVTGIALMLLSPFLRTTTEDIRKPIVVVAKDESQSIETLDQKFKVDEEALQNLISDFEKEYEVKSVYFGDEVYTDQPDSAAYQVTNISNALEYIYDNYGDQNLGAIILATDGIYNEGKNPLYVNAAFKAPMHILAQGDTSIRKDLSVKDIFANKIAYLGDQFVVQIDVAASNLKGANTACRINQISAEGTKRLDQKNILIDDEDFFTTISFTLEALRPGLNRYRVALPVLEGESSTANNFKDFYVEVLDARQKVLILAHAPHPDLSTIKTTLNSNKNYEASIHFPDDKGLNIAEYDFVVLHNLPSQDYKLNAELVSMNKRKQPRLFVVGAQTNHAVFNQIQANISIKGNSNVLEDVQANFQNGFSAFTISEQLNAFIDNFPPLVAPFGQYELQVGSSALLYQKIKKIPTDYPLLSFSDNNGIKTGVWVGEGLWKWRLFDFLKHKNYNHFTELLNKTVQYLGTKDDKRKFRVSTSKNLYKENERIVLEAQLFNDNYEMVNDPDVFLTLKDGDGNQYDYVLNRKNTYYVLDAGMLRPDNYQYEAKTMMGGKSYEAKGYFTVQDIQLELYDLTARHGLLTALADKFNGQSFLPDEIELLRNELLETNRLKPVVYQNTETKLVLHYKWLFLFLFFLLVLEWFLRRYFGSY